MKNYLHKQSSFLLSGMVFMFFLASNTPAHLMVAQHGTLYFLDNSVYMVLSVPASAFTETDADGDHQLSMQEFSYNRSQLINLVAKRVGLSDKQGKLPLNSILVSPVTPHNAPAEPANQIVVMGRFVLSDSSSTLQFRVDLFGDQSESQMLKITATRKSTNQKQVFELSPNSNAMKLNFQ